MYFCSSVVASVHSLVQLMQVVARPTPINLMIGADCLLRVAHIPAILLVARVIRGMGDTFCTARILFAFSIQLLTHLIALSIAFFRWIYVCAPTWVFTSARRRAVNLILAILPATLGSVLTAGAFIYREHNLYLANCLKSGGRAVAGGRAWDLPVGHLFHTPAILCFFR